jgi:NAD-dependent histone deacetylase SIR2
MITTPNRFKTITPIDTTHMDIDAGFRETDRLIAKAAQEVQLASRPSTPPPLLHLPPLNLESVVYDPPVLVALEPKVESSGPRAEISSNVGSPVEARQVGGGNPFFLGDPGVEWLRFPPVWLEQEREEQGYGHAGRWGGRGEGKGYGYGYQGQGQGQGEKRRDGGGGSGSPWCPDEQLRKEQEAALMLSALRGL